MLVAAITLRIRELLDGAIFACRRSEKRNVFYGGGLGEAENPPRLSLGCVLSEHAPKITESPFAVVLQLVQQAAVCFGGPSAGSLRSAPYSSAL